MKLVSTGFQRVNTAYSIISFSDIFAICPECPPCPFIFVIQYNRKIPFEATDTEPTFNQSDHRAQAVFLFDSNIVIARTCNIAQTIQGAGAFSFDPAQISEPHSAAP